MIKNPSVLQDWLLTSCSWRQQTLLFTALRGPDGLPKDNAAKTLCRFLRSCILRDATPNRGTFMGIVSKQAEKAAQDFLDSPDQYPHHFMMHLVHAAEVLGYKHPEATIKKIWQDFYLQMCAGFHMNPETEEQMDARLKDDI